MAARPWRPLRLPHGQHVRDYLNGHVARVDIGGGRSAVVRSTLPLRVRGANGRPVPVNLTLHRAGDSFEPVAPLADSSVALDAREGISLPDVGVRVEPVGVARSRARLLDGKAFYPNIQRDTDWMVMAVPGGIESFTQLRSAASPMDLALRVRMSRGGTLRPTPDRRLGGFEIADGGQVLARLTAPSAWDAARRRVAVSYRVDGGVLRMHVEPSRATVYPVLVDPAVVEDFRSWRTNSALDFNGWNYDSAPASFTPFFGNSFLGNGLYMYNRTTQTYAAGDARRWFFNVLGFGSGYIYEADFTNVYHDPQAQNECAVEGLFNRDATTGQYTGGSSATQCGAVTTYPSVTVCARADCSAAGGGLNSVTFGSRVPAGGTLGSFTDYLGGVAIYQYDEVTPTMANAGFPAGWVDSASNMTVQGTDAGMGMVKVALDSPTKADWDQNRVKDFSPCGDRNHRCPKIVQPAAFTSGNLPEGTSTIRATGTSAVGRTATATWPISIDTTAPVITPSDLLWEFRQIADDPENVELVNSVYRLHVLAQDGANDGDPTHARSGVKAIDVYIDNAQPDPTKMHVQQTCSAGSCPLTLDWDLDAAPLTAGDHPIRVVATDQLNHVSETDFTITKAAEVDSPPPLDSVISSSKASDPPYDDTQGSGIDPNNQDSGATGASSPDTSPGAAPRAAPAFYVPSTSVSAAFKTGCTFGHAHRAGAVILDFGGPIGNSQTILIGGRKVSIDSDVAVSEAYGRGYYHCLPHAFKNRAITLAMGENNSTDGRSGGGGNNVSSGSGTAWANAVDTVSRYFKQRGISSNVSAAGGMDFEPGFGPVGESRAWAQAFTAATPRALYDFGSADGCPPSPARTRRGGSCDNGWTQSDINFLSGRANRLPFPEIYVGPQVPQWPAISLFGVQQLHRMRMFFPGPVTEYHRAMNEFRPSTAWSKLFKAIRRNSKTSQSYMPYSTDFQGDHTWGK